MPLDSVGKMNGPLSGGKCFYHASRTGCFCLWGASCKLLNLSVLKWVGLWSMRSLRILTLWSHLVVTCDFRACHCILEYALWEDSHSSELSVTYSLDNHDLVFIPKGWDGFLETKLQMSSQQRGKVQIFTRTAIKKVICYVRFWPNLTF